MKCIKLIIISIIILSFIGCVDNMGQVPQFKNGDVVVLKIDNTKCMVVGVDYNLKEQIVYEVRVNADKYLYNVYEFELRKPNSGDN